MAILLDTSVLIDYLRGRRSVRDRLERVRREGDQMYVSAINVEETVRGLVTREFEAARVLFAGLRVAPLGEQEGWRAGEWRRAYGARGRTLSQADCLIAAAALSVNARVATGNPKDFPMQDLVVEHWPVGA